MFLKRFWIIALSIVITMLVAACGNATTTGGSLYGGGASPNPSTPPANTGGSFATMIRTATVSIHGKAATVLTDAAGRTLYDLTADTPTSTACSGSCTSIWPPLLTTGAPTSTMALPHQLSALQDANGQQVEYGGHLLYTFSGDTVGQAQGEGIQSFGGTWHAVTPTLIIPGGGSTGGYGYQYTR